MKMPLSKREKMRRRMREEMIIRAYPDEFYNLVSIGFTREQALKKIRGNKISSVAILQRRYEIDKDRPGVLGISLAGIKRTESVERWIDKMEKEGKLIDRGGILEFPIGR